MKLYVWPDGRMVLAPGEGQRLSIAAATELNARLQDARERWLDGKPLLLSEGEVIPVHATLDEVNERLGRIEAAVDRLRTFSGKVTTCGMPMTVDELAESDRLHA